MPLSNQVVLVTGASRGIGAAIVREMLKAGVAKIYATARDVTSLQALPDPRVVPLQLDITSDASVTAAAQLAGDIDVLVNNAGTLAFGDYISSRLETFEDDMRTNYFGTLRVLRAFTPQFVARKSGTIANVSSVVGLSAVPLMAGYSASKAAVHSLTQSLRGTLEKDNITVIGIYPGPIETDLAKPVPYPKVTPDHAAIRIVRAIAEGQTYIFPDPMAQQVEQLWSTDNRKLEHVALHLGG
ncbi:MULTISPECIES: SDR family NAD(P)-dependent oxidoreductase [Inquilinus]|uniref:NAD(P)-dependent dehydrogenase (Short-subunit alcohol dehydrogenase family) n=1 Tax=Inquilinus ginsengisoli TaxID=363840 RepID=A0ABU1JTW7_9PROT|nr:SDR family NAD(P)-dependent oxidoreductase [Inquilinus ginsengisoli]MDR6291434.1 NAD(P)-dependent dehydrogenase (short-subunit alcohol dehydrogenase family) [Inquilinus ginsengisoli]